MELQSARLKRGPAVIGNGRTHRRAIATDRVGLPVASAFNVSLNGPDAANALFEFFLGMTICLIDGLRCLAKIMEVA